MSSKIYFNQAGRFSFRRKLINVSTRLHHTLAPKHARKTARKLLLTPVRNKRTVEQPAGLIQQQVLTSEGQLMTYKLGSGPTWVLSHGWSGSASQFFPLMEHIAAAGFTALAYDHPAHGHSEGQFGHLPGFIKAFDQLLDQQSDIAGVIAHSMGCAMVLESRHNLLKDRPVLLVAPVLNYTENLVETVRKSGYSTKLFNEIVEEIALQYQYPFESIDPYQRLKRKQAEAVIVHDKYDKFARFEHSQQAADLGHVNLVATEGLGHGRILTSNPLKDAFDQVATQN